jgi:UDP-N-acetylglucosamine:LPS N-acetylglucosamine transferase
VCGHNAVLADKLRALRPSAPRVIVGFTSQMSYYMQLSDFFIGKPGPGSISEAVQQGLPVIVVRNAFTMPQERYNTAWVEENGVGVVLDSFKMIREGVAHIADNIELYRAGVEHIHNRAVFEIPDILQRILAAPARIGVDVIQHLRAAERLHLS